MFFLLCLDFGKAFASVHRANLWYKLRRNGISDNMLKCVGEIYDEVKFCVKCGEHEVTVFIEQKRGARQGCSLTPYLLNIFTDDLIDYINKKTHMHQ
jgi:hypothetical protein